MMNTSLNMFGPQLAAEEHAVMALDQAGCHGASNLRLLNNVTLVLLPPYVPQLNPVERFWRHLREGFLSHRLLDDDEAIVDASCQAWNQLTLDACNHCATIPPPYKSMFGLGGMSGCRA